MPTISSTHGEAGGEVTAADDTMVDSAAKLEISIDTSHAESTRLQATDMQKVWSITKRRWTGR